MNTVNNERFLIVKYIKNFIIDLEKILITIPKKDYLSRNTLYINCIELLELIYSANYSNVSSEKKKLQLSALAKIGVIDFYLERAYKIGFISEKKLLSKSKELSKINKMIFGWYSGTE